MKNSFLILLAVVVTALIGCDSTTKNDKVAVVDSIQYAIDQHADSLLLDSKINSVSIGVYKDGKSYIGHYGVLDSGAGNKPTNNTIYEIASVSKTFAGLLVAQAELDGKLSLEDDIRQYLDGDYSNFEFDGYPIKIKHLITHTSRLPKFLPDEINALFENIDETLPFKLYEIEKDYNKDKFFEDLKTIRIDTIPGTKYDYSNIDTELVAHILESIYGQTYEELLKKYIGDVAQMPNTKITLNDADKLQLANGYGESMTKVPHLVNSLWGAGGGVKSTMPDLINYMKYQLDSIAVVELSHEVVDEKSGTAYYWPVDTDEEDGTYYGHHGGALGTQNFFFIFPKHNMGLSIITNQSDMETAGKLYKTVGAILDDIR